MGVLAWGRKAFTTLVNVRVDQWIGYQGIKGSVLQIKGVIKPAFTIDQAEYKEEFDEATQRLNLEQADLIAREQEFTKLFVIYLLIALGIFMYSIYLFVTGNWGGGLMSLCISLYPLNLAFRFHFWLFQLRNHKLGCSLKDWWNAN